MESGTPSPLQPLDILDEVMINKCLGLALRKERLRVGKTLQQVANTGIIKLGQLSELELGKRHTSIERIEKLAQFYGITMRSLFSFAKPFNNPVEMKSNKPLMKNMTDDDSTAREKIARMLTAFAKRRRKKMSLKDVANATGFSPTYVGAVRTGKEGGIHAWIKIAHAIGMPIDELFACLDKSDSSLAEDDWLNRHLARLHQQKNPL